MIYYLLIVGPFLLLSLVASSYVKGAFGRWSKYSIRRGMTGAEVAAAVLRAAGLHGVRIEESQGHLSDHYDPRERVVRLSPDVYRTESIAACAVAAHEVGHAIQHAEQYAPLALRSFAVPAATIGSNFSYLLLFAGLFFALTPLVWVGIILFCCVVVFQLITLPVEFDASKRAKLALGQLGLVSEEEARGVSNVLTAAALTYVAAAATSIATLVYYLMLVRGSQR